MLLPIVAIKLFCQTLARDNRKKFNHLNPVNPENELKPGEDKIFKIYFSETHIFEHFFGSIINNSKHYVQVSEDWKDVMKNNYSLDRIRTNQNIKKQKQKNYEKKN